jgi:carboxylesterase
VDGARDELLRLQGARRTVAVGCSMGALAALVLAHEHPERVDGLVLLAPALELAILPRLVGWAGRSAWGGALPLVPKGASDVRDPEMRRRNPAMAAVPASAVGELLRMQEHVGRILPQVTAPVLVVAGAQDHTVTLRGVRKVASELARARLVVLPDSFHLVGIDVERDVVADEAERFIRTIPARREEG